MDENGILASDPSDALSNATDGCLLGADVFGTPPDDESDGTAIGLTSIAAEPEEDAFWFEDISQTYVVSSGGAEESSDAPEGGNPFLVICTRPFFYPKGDPATDDSLPDFAILPYIGDELWNPVEPMPVEGTDDASKGDTGRIGWFEDAEWTDEWTDGTEWTDDWIDDSEWTDEWFDDTDWADDTEWTDEWTDDGEWTGEWTDDGSLGETKDGTIGEEPSVTDDDGFIVIDWEIETGLYEPGIAICPIICIGYPPMDDLTILV